MTTIVVMCLECDREVHIADHDVVLRIRTPFEGEYRFTCPKCCKRNRRDADERVIRLLLSGGVNPICDHVPAELAEPRPGGAPFQPDDVLGFNHYLQGDTWFQDLLRMTAP